MANTILSNFSQRKGADTSSANDRINSVLNVAKVRNSAPAQQKSYKYTTNGGKEYTLSQDQVDWVKKRYQSAWGNYYGVDDDDRQRQSAGLMPSAIERGYKGNDLDQQLFKYGLPSSRYLEGYIEDYYSWYGNGDTLKFGNDEAEQYIRDKYKSTWQYDPTNADDVRRQAAGEPPAALADAYSDSYFDEDLYKRGLPPASAMEDFTGKWNTHATNQARISDFYRDVSAKWYDLELSDKRNTAEKYDQEDGTKISGSKMFENAFYDTLMSEDYADVRAMFRKGTTVASSDDYASNTAFREAEVAAMVKSEGDDEDFVSYSDFLKQYPEFKKKFGAEKVVDAVLNAQGIGTLSEAMDASDERIATKKADAEYAAVTDKTSAKAYVDAHKDAYADDPGKMLSDMQAGGVERDQLWQVKDYLEELYKDDKDKKAEIVDWWSTVKESYRNGGILKPFVDVTRGIASALGADTVQAEADFRNGLSYDGTKVAAGSVETAVQGLLDSGLSGDEIVTVINRSIAKGSASETSDGRDVRDVARNYMGGIHGRTQLQGLVSDIVKNGEAADLSTVDVSDALKLFQDNIVYTNDGYVDENSIAAAFDALEAAGASTSVMQEVASQIAFDDGRSAWDKIWDAIAAVKNPSAAHLSDESRVLPTARSNTELTVREALRATKAEANNRDRGAIISAAAPKLRAMGYTDFEIDQAFSEVGWSDGLNADDWARDYFAEVEYPRILAEQNPDNGMETADVHSLALAVWADMSKEDRQAYVDAFQENRDYNVDLYKPHGEQLLKQYATLIPAAVTDVVAGAVNFADMVTGKKQWEASQRLNELSAKLNSYGKAADQDFASDAISMSRDTVKEVVRMYAVNGIGSLAGNAFLGLAGVNTATATAETISGLNKLTKTAFKLAQTTPFVTGAMGSYYAEALAGGADHGQAIAYGLACGTAEGLIEKFNMDSLWGKALGSKSFGKTLVAGGKAFKAADVVGKARAVSLISSFLGEATEEGVGYMLSWHMQNEQGWNPSEFSWDELSNNMLMGGLTGLLGSAVQVGNVNANRIMADYILDSGDYSSTNFDILFAAANVSGMKDEAYAQYSELGTKALLSTDQMESAMRNIVQNTRQLDAMPGKRDTELSRLNQERENRSKQVQYLLSLRGDAIDRGDIDGANKIGERLIEATQDQRAFEAKYADRVGDIEAAYAEVTKQHNDAITDSQRKLDAHYVAMYNVFSPDVAAIAKRTAASKKESAAYENHVKATYETDRFMDEGIADADAYGAAVTAQGEAAIAEDAAAGDVGTAVGILSETERKMQAVRAGTFDEYQKQREAQAGADTTDGQTAQPVAPERVALSAQEIEGTKAVGQRLGRDIEVRDDLEPWVDGYRDGNKLVLNAKQAATDDMNPYQASVFRVLVHELTHSMEGSKAYDEFSDYVMQRVMAETGLEANRLYEIKRDEYLEWSNGTVDLSPGKARREIVARWSQENLLKNEDSINTLVREQSGLAGRVLNWVQYQIAKTKARSMPDAEDAKILLKAERMYVKAFAASGQNAGDGVRQYMFGSSNGIDTAREKNIDIGEIFNGRDDHPRFFISDKAAAVDLAALNNAPQDGSIKLGNVLTHESLYELYPFLTNVDVRFSDLKTANAQFNPYTMTIDIDREYYASHGKTNVTSTILHETQHAIQAYEDILSGESVGTAGMVLLEQAYRLAQQDPDWESSTPAQRRAILVDIYDSDGMVPNGNPDESYMARDRYKKSLSEYEAFFTEAAYYGIKNEASAPDVQNGARMAADRDALAARIDLILKDVGLKNLDNLMMKGFNKRNKPDVEVLLNAAISFGYYELPGLDAGRTGKPVFQTGPRPSGGVRELGRLRSGPMGESMEGQMGGGEGAASPTEQAGVSTQPGAFSSPETVMYSVPSTSWADLIAKYGAQDQGRNPRARDIEVPNRINDDETVGKTIRSALESKHVSDELLPRLKQSIMDGDTGTYVPVSNAETTLTAQNLITRLGQPKAHEQFARAVDSGKVNASTIALGEQLLAEAATRNDMDGVMSILTDLCIAGTESGRTVQAFKLLKDMGGLGSAYYMQKAVQRVNDRFANDIANGKMDPISIDPALMDDLINAKTEAEVQLAEDAIGKYIGERTPLTTMQALSNWRYFSMLANPVTHIRNITGNAMMAGMTMAKDAVATGIERVFVADKSQRAHAVYLKGDQTERIATAKQMFGKYKNDIANGGKLGFEELISRSSRLSNNKALDKVMRANSDLLEKEDVALFMKPTFIRAFTQYMVAQEIDPSGMTAAQERAAANWAISEAQRATFRDASKLAASLNSLAKTNPAVKLIVEGLVPFKKTPVNIAARGVDYSPIGILVGVKKAVFDVKAGKCTTADAVDRISSGLVGSGLMALGAFLAKAGILRGSGEDDDNYESFLQATGEQGYSLNFGDVSINISSIAPATIPLFMGAGLFLPGEEDGERQFDDILEMIASTTNPLMEMSFMASLNEALKSYGSSDGLFGNLGSVALKAAQSYASQYIPTIGGKIAAAFDPTIRTSKGDATAPLGAGADSWFRGVLKKVPGVASLLEPSVNVKGEQTQKSTFGDWALDFANKFVFPSNVKVKNRTETDEELIRVYEATGNTDILPTTQTKKYVTVDGKNLYMDAKQFTAYSEERGQTVYAAIKSAMASFQYENSDDAGKAAILKKAVEKAEGIVRDKWKEALSE